MRKQFVLFLLSGAVAGAQAQQKSNATGWLSLRTIPSNAEIFVDGKYCGKTPLHRMVLDSGKHILKAFYPSRVFWNGTSKVENIVVAQGEEKTLSWELENIVSLNSVPSGSSVLFEGRPLGVTPFSFKSTRELTGDFVMQKDGFKSVSIPVSGPGFFAATVRLDRVEPREEWNFSDVLSPDSNGEPDGQWVNYAAGSLMIVSGVLAAYYKDHANREFDNYQQSKNSDVLDAVRRFDKRSGVSFTITQLSFAVLAYKLLLE